jgi:hypothetical protein
MKKCRKCGSERPESEFYKTADGRGGLNARCKECIKSVSREDYARRLAKDPDYDNRRYKGKRQMQTIWHMMIARCHNPENQGYSKYGARGIAVCERWRSSFEAFYEDMGDQPAKGYTVDRVDNNGPYSPENCRWATMREQNRNRRSTKFVTHNGETRCLKEWAETIGMTPQVLYDRLRWGWTFEEAISEPVRKTKKKAA